MKHSTKPDHRNNAFTLIDLLVIVFVIALLASMLIPANKGGEMKAQRIVCIFNLKEVFSGFKVWEGDNNDQFPMNASTNQQSIFECTNDNEMYRYFQAASNQLATPKILICPADTRYWITNWAYLQNSNISYFLCLNATEAYPGMIVSGDRNVVGGTKLANGFTVFNPTNSVQWGSDMHHGQGNIGLTDGSVAQLTSSGMAQALVQATNGVTSGTVRYAFP